RPNPQLQLISSRLCLKPKNKNDESRGNTFYLLHLFSRFSAKEKNEKRKENVSTSRLLPRVLSGNRAGAKKNNDDAPHNPQTDVSGRGFDHAKEEEVVVGKDLRRQRRQRRERLWPAKKCVLVKVGVWNFEGEEEEEEEKEWGFLFLVLSVEKKKKKEKKPSYF
ncbi:unnamed protein product, partial [Linum tenue]